MVVEYTKEMFIIKLELNLVSPIVRQFNNLTKCVAVAFGLITALTLIIVWLDMIALQHKDRKEYPCSLPPNDPGSQRRERCNTAASTKHHLPSPAS